MRLIETSKVTLPINATIKDAIVKLNENSEKIILILDGYQKIVCVITDGDIRRAILIDNNLDRPAVDIGNKSPLVAKETLGENQILSLMSKNNIEHIPVVDSSNKFKFVYRMASRQRNKITTAVIMAGGLGTRLRPLTENIPKPLADISGKPILERIILLLIEHDITKIYISINYLGEMIEQVIGDGSRFGVKIQYVREEEKLGTAGSLSLIKDQISGNFFVLNADISTRVDLSELSKKHCANGNIASIAVAQNEVQIPYGVIMNGDDGKLIWEEKPKYSFLAAVGIYVLSDRIFKYLPEIPQRVDMPELLIGAQGNKETLSLFPLFETWADIANIEDLNMVRQTFSNI
ncbi:sugar phosphate nucleotidyltransferase [Alphaproteobacteria bacterium LSUCC0719]